MNKEKDFFKTCFDTIAGLEVKNESQAIAKEVVLSEIERLQQENKKLNGAIQTYDILLKVNVEENKQLQQENKQLKENAENNDKVVDKVNWENMLLKKENLKLKNINEEYERLNKEKFRGFKITNVQKYNIDELLSYKDNWNKLKEWLESNWEESQDIWFVKIINKMQELEGSDSNE